MKENRKKAPPGWKVRVGQMVGHGTLKGKTLVEIFGACTEPLTLDLVEQYLARNRGSKGGASTSSAKARAARRNGRKGGRPKKPNAERKKVVGGGGRNATKRSGAGSQNA